MRRRILSDARRLLLDATVEGLPLWKRSRVAAVGSAANDVRAGCAVMAVTKHGWSNSLIAADLAETTRDAYSFRYYGAREWRRCCDLLIGRGYHYIEADAILRSKLTRLAADVTERNGFATSELLAKLLDSMTPADLVDWIGDCVIAINFPDLKSSNRARRCVSYTAVEADPFTTLGVTHESLDRLPRMESPAVRSHWR
jgi:hypothetical protein